MKRFEIKILRQYWVDEDPANEEDLCSHGTIELRINDVVISDESDDDWTISTTGLMLLRSLTEQHRKDASFPMVLHCGMVIMVGCPIRIDWNSNIQNGNVVISDVEKAPTTSGKEVVHYPAADTVVPHSEYTAAVQSFCQEIIDFFSSSKPRRIDKFDKGVYEEFWNEFNTRLNSL